MDRVNHPYNIYQQKAIQTLKTLSQKYSDEMLIQSLFSKSCEGEIEKEIYIKLNELKKTVSLEDLSSFLYHIINGETYDTIIFSSELPSPLRNQDLNETEENEKMDEETERSNKKNVIRIKLREESEGRYEKRYSNRSRKNDLFHSKKHIEYNNILFNKPIINLQKANNLEISRIIPDKKENKQNNINKPLSSSVEFTSVCHKNQIRLYNILLKKLSYTHNLTFSEFTKFCMLRRKLNKLLRKKSCKRIREKIINGLGIIGKHFTKNKKGEIYCYKPKCVKRGKVIEYVCAEGDKCGSFGYYNLSTKKFTVKGGHKLPFNKHKINFIKDRYFVRKLIKNEKLSDVQEYIKFNSYE